MTTLAEAVTKGRGIERSFNCPTHQDRNASASVNVVKGLWTCYACGAGGTVEGAPPPDVETIASALFDATITPSHPETWLDLFDADHPSTYWAQRFGYDTAVKFRCGTNPLTSEPTYPIREATPPHKIIGVVTRTEGTPKYKYPFGAVTSSTLFNIEELTRTHPRTLILCEGATDVMAIYQAIPDLAGKNAAAVGCFGSSIHEPQRRIITGLRPRRIITAFDNDKAGYKAKAQAIATFAGHCDVLSVPVDRVNDIAEMDIAERRKAILTSLESK